jgi:hypothetical protein
MTTTPPEPGLEDLRLFGDLTALVAARDYDTALLHARIHGTEVLARIAVLGAQLHTAALIDLAQQHGLTEDQARARLTGGFTGGVW